MVDTKCYEDEIYTNIVAVLFGILCAAGLVLIGKWAKDFFSVPREHRSLSRTGAICIGSAVLWILTEEVHMIWTFSVSGDSGELYAAWQLLGLIPILLKDCTIVSFACGLMDILEILASYPPARAPRRVKLAGLLLLGLHSVAFLTLVATISERNPDNFLLLPAARYVVISSVAVLLLFGALAAYFAFETDALSPGFLRKHRIMLCVIFYICIVLSARAVANVVFFYLTNDGYCDLPEYVFHSAIDLPFVMFLLYLVLTGRDASSSREEADE